MNSAFALAAVAAAIGFCVHTFVGSKYVVAPLLVARGITPVSRWLMFMCWHAVTIVLVFLTLAYGWAALTPGEPARLVVVTLTVLTAMVTALVLYVCLRGGLPPWRIPPMWLFPILTILSVAGLAA